MSNRVIKGITVESDDEAIELMARLYDGAPGAYPRETKVVKINEEPGDYTPNGTMGVVKGSLGIPDEVVKDFKANTSISADIRKFTPKYMYAVAWEGSKLEANVLCLDYKVKLWEE